MTEYININESYTTFTDSALTERIKKELASTKIDKEKYKQEIEKNRITEAKNYYDYDLDLDFSKDLKIIDDRKYYNRAFHYQKIGLFKEKDIPWLKISLKDLPLDLLEALSRLEPKEREYIAKQAYGRIFEDINSDIYRTNISSIMKVKFIDGQNYDSEYTILLDDNDVNNDDIQLTKNDLITKILSEQQDIENSSKLQEQKNNSIPTLSVAAALRSDEGETKVCGTIVSVTSLFKMVSEIDTQCNNCQDSQTIKLEKPEFQPRLIKKCSNCNEDSIFANYRHVSAVKITLQDISNFNETDQLTVILFEKDTLNIVVGEQVIISGKIYISQDKRQGKLYSVLYADKLEYQNKTDISLSEMDIQAIERFTKKMNQDNNNIIDKLGEMAFPDVIGNKIPKKGLLLGLVNSGEDKIGKRKRIHVLAIGGPGLGKSTLIRSAVRFESNGRFESGQHSSGKSLTAIISKEEDDRYVLRLGAVALANGSVCGINEIGRMNPEEQGYFLDAMEEGELTINKHGIHARIKASTTVFATANPRQQNYSTDEIINLDSIPAINALLNRFDLIFEFSNFKNSEELREYINIKSEREDKKQPDYSNYVKKHIAYSKRFNPTINEEAKSILNEYFIELSKRRSPFITPRRRESLYRIARAIARIKLKDVVDVNDAKEAVEFYNVMISKFLRTVKIPENPRDIAYGECISVLKKFSNFGGITLEEVFKKACENNQQISSYFGIDKSLRIDKNYKTRIVYEMLQNNQNVRIINEKPVVLQWISSPPPTNIKEESQSSPPTDLSDLSDVNQSVDKNKNNIINLGDTKNNNIVDNKARSYTSDTSDSILSNQEFNNPLITASDLSNGKYDSQIINSIYRIKETDLWLCKNCKMRGDKWYMMKHPCQGNKKKKRNT